jgi:hypothetical protein
MRTRPEIWVGSAGLLAWALAGIWILGPDRSPFTQLGAVAGALLIVVGALIAFDVGGVVERLNSSGFARPFTRYRKLSGLAFIVIGIIFMVAAILPSLD